MSRNIALVQQVKVGLDKLKWRQLEKLMLA